MNRVVLGIDFDEWRAAAREALHQGYRPDEIDFEDGTVPVALNLALEAEEAPHGPPLEHPRVTKQFLEIGETVAAHRDPARWNLLYRVLYRLQGEGDLLKIEIDEDVAGLLRLKAQVQRDLHKMHAFVRFRKVLAPGTPGERPVVIDEALPLGSGNGEEHHLLLQTPTPFGPIEREIEECDADTGAENDSNEECEYFVAWYEPDHRILPMAAPFFAERFSVMRWTILSPDASVTWDPALKKATFGPGVPRDSAPQADELESLWRSYYASIYNPARLNTAAMRNEMPVRYWKNLPEVNTLPALIAGSKGRVSGMMARQQQAATAQPYVPEEHSQGAIAAALPGCRGCELYNCATQVVPGRGSGSAGLMLVGEQPGDQEDRQGEPFVGPAGAVLDRILEELRIPRASLFVTNAVKHFKFVQRGKLRLHQNPRMSEITACRPWLLAELDAIKPKVVLCLGASASKSLLGGTFALMKDHGKVLATPYAERVVATIHPSAVLRARDEESQQQLRHFLAEDLAMAWKLSLS